MDTCLLYSEKFVNNDSYCNQLNLDLEVIKIQRFGGSEYIDTNNISVLTLMAILLKIT